MDAFLLGHGVFATVYNLVGNIREKGSHTQLNSLTF